MPVSCHQFFHINYSLPPFVLFQGGVVIVDSPGICDSEHVSKIALKYLPQAYAFIYVINSSNAGGLQEDRVSETT